MADILDTLRGLDRGWQAVLGSGLAVLTAASTTVALHRPDPASADTKVLVARLAQVYLPDGSNHAATEGEVLPRGAELHTGQGGGAQLSTAGRVVYLDGLSTLTVRDGVRETLSRGAAMVDARDGAHLDLSTPAGLVATPDGAVTRVEEGLLTRVAVYDGTVSLHPVGRSSTTLVPALHQVKIQPQSLPQRATPLQLRGDSWDRRVAADLVSADEDLNSLADGLALGEGASYLRAVSAAFRPSSVPAPGAARGEEALAVAVAQAAEQPTGPEALAQVRADRADLGSWGVVAALVHASVSRVSAAVNTALSPGTSAAGPTIVNAIDPRSISGGAPTVAPSPGSSPTSRPTTGPTATPVPTVTATPGVVTALVDKVLTLVSPSPATLLPTPLPVPLPGASKKTCLLGVVC